MKYDRKWWEQPCDECQEARYMCECTDANWEGYDE